MKIKEHIPRHLYKLGRYLRIWYDSQPTNSSNTQHITTNHTQDTSIPINYEAPTLSQPQPNVTVRHKKKLHQNDNQKSTDKKQKLNNIHATPQNIKQSLFPPQSHPYYLQHKITHYDTPSITPPQSSPYCLQCEHWYKQKPPDSSSPIVSSYHPPIEEEVSWNKGRAEISTKQTRYKASN